MHHHLHLGKSQKYVQQMDKQVKTQIPNQMKIKIRIQNLEKEIQTQKQMQNQKQKQTKKKRVEVEQGKKDLLKEMKEMEMQLKNPLLMKIFQIMLSSYSSS